MFRFLNIVGVAMHSKTTAAASHSLPEKNLDPDYAEQAGAAPGPKTPLGKTPTIERSVPENLQTDVKAVRRQLDELLQAVGAELVTQQDRSRQLEEQLHAGGTERKDARTWADQLEEQLHAVGAELKAERARNGRLEEQLHAVGTELSAERVRIK